MSKDPFDDVKFSPAVLEAFSYVISTAVEGGSYTADDVASWSEYAHADGPFGFQAAVTVVPNKDGKYAGVEGDPAPIRVTADWFARKIVKALINTMAEKLPLLHHDPMEAKIPKHLYEKVIKLEVGDEDVAGEIDVVDAGALLQIAVYGEVLYG